MCTLLKINEVIINSGACAQCNVLQSFTKGVDKEMVCLMAARASRMENQDAIDAAIVGCLADPKEVNSSLESLVSMECVDRIEHDPGFECCLILFGGVMMAGSCWYSRDSLPAFQSGGQANGHHLH